MADITKCLTDDCAIKETCFRHTASFGAPQSVAHFEPREDKTCAYYWPVPKEHPAWRTT